MIFYILAQVRTNNFTDPDVANKIAQNWATAKQKLNNFDGEVYGLYFDYQNNYNGDYTTAVAITHPIDNTLQVKVEDNQKYRVFTVKDSHYDDIYQMWEHIWSLEQNGDLFRSYAVDFEKYYPDGHAEIYIGIIE